MLEYIVSSYIYDIPPWFEFRSFSKASITSKVDAVPPKFRRACRAARWSDSLHVAVASLMVVTAKSN
jgi:hypothetical protein